MRFRLFKLGRRARRLALGLGTLELLALGAACGGEKFTANGNPNASGSGGAGAGSQAGETGESGSGEGGSSGDSSGGGELISAGSAGKPPVGCDCTGGEYCQDGTNKCRKCADFSRLEFGAAQKLTTLAQTAQSIERFPRSAGGGAALFYVSGRATDAKILYAASPFSSVGVPLTLPTQVENGPLLVSGFIEEKNLFFDRQQASRRKLMMALWTAPDLRTDEVLIPGDLNTPDSDDYSIAISLETGHVYWMSTRSGSPELVWQPTSMSAPPPASQLNLKVRAGSAECARSGEDATPWVNVAGTLLLFRNPSLNEGCEPNDSGATDLFAAPLDKEGEPATAAISLASLNSTGGMSQETTPSMSPDSCVVYFASDNGTGDFDLYKANRN